MRGTQIVKVIFSPHCYKGSRRSAVCLFLLNGEKVPFRDNKNVAAHSTELHCAQFCMHFSEVNFTIFELATF